MHNYMTSEDLEFNAQVVWTHSVNYIRALTLSSAALVAQKSYWLSMIFIIHQLKKKDSQRDSNDNFPLNYCIML